MRLLRYCPWSSADIVAGILRVHLPDARTVLDATYGNGKFWNGSAPVTVLTMDIDTSKNPDVVADFTTMVGVGMFDVVVFDPPHLADAGKKSLMGKRFGTYKNHEIKQVVMLGARQSWLHSHKGVIIKVADHVHGQRFVPMTDWVKEAIPAPVYDVVHQTRRTSLRDPKWKRRQLSAYNNGATYLIYRKDGPIHKCRS